MRPIPQHDSTCSMCWCNSRKLRYHINADSSGSKGGYSSMVMNGVMTQPSPPALLVASERFPAWLSTQLYEPAWPATHQQEPAGLHCFNIAARKLNKQCRAWYREWKLASWRLLGIYKQNTTLLPSRTINTALLLHHSDGFCWHSCYSVNPLLSVLTRIPVYHGISAGQFCFTVEIHHACLYYALQQHALFFFFYINLR